MPLCLHPEIRTNFDLLKDMKNRLVSLFALCAILLSGAFFSGCEDTATIPAPTFFGQIRIMNFSVCASARSYDVYLYPENGPVDTIAIAPGLAYGISTSYITNLATNKGAGQMYILKVRPAGDKSKDLISTTIMINQNDKWSFVIFSEVGEGKPEFKLINDKPTPPTEANKAYFRFMNTMPGGDPGPIMIRIDDPLSGEKLTTDPINYKDISNYVGFKTATDSTLTFYAVKEDGTVLGRLAGVALEGGSYQTLTWAGNCAPSYRTQPDGTLVRDDSNRIRRFVDSEDGNDATIPVPQTMRINFVNAVVNGPNMAESDPRYAALHYDQLGVVIDNDTRFNFPSMTPFSVGPAPTFTEGLPNGSTYYENRPIAFPLNDAVNVKGFKIDPAKPTERGPLLFDYRAGERINIMSDMITTFIAHDSVRYSKKVSGKDTTYSYVPFDSTRYQFVVPMPDVPSSSEATLVLVNALAPGAKLPVTTANIKYYLDDVQVPYQGNWSIKKYKTVPHAPGTIAIKATLNTTPVEEVTTTCDKFEAGGIYEIILVGSRNHANPNMRPRFVILRVNPK